MGPILTSLLNEVQKHVPKAQIKFKDQSAFMKFLGALMFFNKDFMTRYTTTIGFTVYMPSEAVVTANDDGYAHVFSHESVHMGDYKKWGLLFKLSYLLPQLLAVLSIFSLLAIWFSKLWLLNLLWLGMLAPIPAYFRSLWELRGYTMSMAYYYWRDNTEPNPASYMDRFTGSDYFFMWPLKSSMTKRLANMVELIKNGGILADEPYKIVYDWVESQKTAKVA